MSCFLPANNTTGGRRDARGSAGADSDGAAPALQLQLCQRKPQHIICWSHSASSAALVLQGLGRSSSQTSFLTDASWVPVL